MAVVTLFDTILSFYILILATRNMSFSDHFMFHVIFTAFNLEKFLGISGLKN